MQDTSERKGLELQAQIIAQQAMFGLINRSLRFNSNLFEPYPNRDGTANMVSNDSSLATLITFNAGQPFGLTVKLLDLPADL